MEPIPIFGDSSHYWYRSWEEKGNKKIKLKKIKKKKKIRFSHTLLVEKSGREKGHWPSL